MKRSEDVKGQRRRGGNANSPAEQDPWDSTQLGTLRNWRERASELSPRRLGGCTLIQLTSCYRRKCGLLVSPRDSEAWRCHTCP